MLLTALKLLSLVVSILHHTLSHDTLRELSDLGEGKSTARPMKANL